MIKPVQFNKNLLKVAVLTSAGFGLFGVLPLLFLPPFERDRMLPPPPPREIMEARLQVSIPSVLITVTILILALWVMNIFLFQQMRKLPWEEKKTQLLRYLVSYAAAFAIMALCMLLVKHIPFIPGLRGGPKGLFPHLSAIIYNTVVIIALDLIVLQQRKSQIELENAELRMNHILAQHQHLKHQLQPHFLFNSLNILKSLIRKQPKEAEEYLIRLSDFLRSSITFQNSHVATLKEELRICLDYLEMQKVRFKDALTYELDVPEEVKEEKNLPIFSLQLLVENAIKHNAFTAEEPLMIRIRYCASDKIIVTNNKRLKQLHEESSGVGLMNLRERYKVIDGHDVVILDTENTFTVELQLLNL